MAQVIDFANASPYTQKDCITVINQCLNIAYECEGYSVNDYLRNVILGNQSTYKYGFKAVEVYFQKAENLYKFVNSVSNKVSIPGNPYDFYLISLDQYVAKINCLLTMSIRFNFDIDHLCYKYQYYYIDDQYVITYNVARMDELMKAFETRTASITKEYLVYVYKYKAVVSMMNLLKQGWSIKFPDGQGLTGDCSAETLYEDLTKIFNRKSNVDNIISSLREVRKIVEESNDRESIIALLKEVRNIVNTLCDKL